MKESQKDFGLVGNDTDGAFIVFAPGHSARADYVVPVPADPTLPPPSAFITPVRPLYKPLADTLAAKPTPLSKTVRVSPKSCLPDDAAARKRIPLATGLFDYFPAALAEVAKVSQIGNDQHNPGKPLGWDRSKSADEADAMLRHFLDRGAVGPDGVRETARMVWRALAILQKELEAANLAPLPRGAVNG